MNGEAVRRFLAETDHLLVVSHVHPDGDAIGSTLATAHLLRLLGKRVTLVNESPIPEKFSFLPGVGEIVQPSALHEKFSYVVAVDCADASRVGDCQQLYADAVRLLNIDHHTTNDSYGTVNIVIPEAAATAEILFQLVEELGVDWTHELAMCVYTGLLTDTGGFRYSNTRPHNMRQAAKLMELGIDAALIADITLQTTTMEQLQLLQTALQSLDRSADGLVAWMSLDLADLQKYMTTNEDLDGIVNYARNIQGVEVGILMRQVDAETVKVSFRSRSYINVSAIAKSFGGGGHERAAGCTFHGTLAEAKAEIIPRVIAAGERGEQ